MLIIRQGYLRHCSHSVTSMEDVDEAIFCNFSWAGRPGPRLTLGLSLITISKSGIRSSAGSCPEPRRRAAGHGSTQQAEPASRAFLQRLSQAQTRIPSPGWTWRAGGTTESSCLSSKLIRVSVSPLLVTSPPLIGFPRTRRCSESFCYHQVYDETEISGPSSSRMMCF